MYPVLWKESLNSDGQFNNSTNINKTNIRLSPQTIEHKKNTTHNIRNQGPVWGQVHERDRVKAVKWISTFPSW